MLYFESYLVIAIVIGVLLRVIAHFLPPRRSKQVEAPIKRDPGQGAAQDRWSGIRPQSS